MRETWALRIAVLTGALVVLLSALYAWLEGRSPEAPLAPGRTGPPPDAASAARGRLVWEREHCVACHSVGGAGNPRSPLDRVASRRDADALRLWTLGQGEAAAALPRTARQAKEAYEDLPGEDLDALVAYLQSLTPP